MINFAGSIWGTIAQADRSPGLIVRWELWLSAVLAATGATAVISVWAMATAVLFREDRLAEARIAIAVGAVLLVAIVVSTVSLNV